MSAQKGVNVTDNEYALQERVNRLEDIVLTLTGWLVEAQSGLGNQDFQGVAEKIKNSRMIYEMDAAKDEE
jgi:hypothetical protein